MSDQPTPVPAEPTEDVCSVDECGDGIGPCPVHEPTPVPADAPASLSDTPHYVSGGQANGLDNRKEETGVARLDGATSQDREGRTGTDRPLHMGQDGDAGVRSRSAAEVGHLRADECVSAPMPEVSGSVADAPASQQDVEPSFWQCTKLLPNCNIRCNRREGHRGHCFLCVNPCGGEICDCMTPCQGCDEPPCDLGREYHQSIGHSCAECDPKDAPAPVAKDEPNHAEWCRLPKPHWGECSMRVPSEPASERITHVAIRQPNGTIHSMECPPSSHVSVAEGMKKAGYDAPLKMEQGFTTNTGRFVDRAEAKRIAKRAGQIVNPISGSEDLFSEELWIREPASEGANPACEVFDCKHASEGARASAECACSPDYCVERFNTYELNCCPTCKHARASAEEGMVFDESEIQVIGSAIAAAHDQHTARVICGRIRRLGHELGDLIERSFRTEHAVQHSPDAPTDEAQSDGDGIREVLRAALHESADKIADEIGDFAVELLKLTNRRADMEKGR